MRRVLPRACAGGKQGVVAPFSLVQRRCVSSSSFAEDGGSGSSDEGRGSNTCDRGGPGNMAARAATMEERRRITRNWENAFFGRVHYEPGMHENYQAAIDAEEKEEEGGALLDKSNRELFPDWPEDEEAPLHEFRRLPDSLKRRYIINRLAMGERRVVYAADYGGLLMMQHLNLGELMLNEAERLLDECGWLNAAVTTKIDALRECAAKIKFDFDLD